jgi:hypothetical protein
MKKQIEDFHTQFDVLIAKDEIDYEDKQVEAWGNLLGELMINSKNLLRAYRIAEDVYRLNTVDYEPGEHIDAFMELNGFKKAKSDVPAWTNQLCRVEFDRIRYRIISLDPFGDKVIYVTHGFSLHELVGFLATYRLLKGAWQSLPEDWKEE